jgi:hypothetical protein
MVHADFAETWAFNIPYVRICARAARDSARFFRRRAAAAAAAPSSSCPSHPSLTPVALFCRYFIEMLLNLINHGLGNSYEADGYNYETDEAGREGFCDELYGLTPHDVACMCAQALWNLTPALRDWQKKRQLHYSFLNSVFHKVIVLYNKDWDKKAFEMGAPLRKCCEYERERSERKDYRRVVLSGRVLRALLALAMSVWLTFFFLLA